MTSSQSTQLLLNAPPTIRDISQKQYTTLGNESNDFKMTQNPNLQPALSQNYAIQFQLKNISREVQMITEKGKTLLQKPQMHTSQPLAKSLGISQLNIDLSRILNLKTNAQQLGKYNYYGHQYRFESQKPLYNQEKPLQFNQTNQNEELKSFSPTTKYQPKRQELNSEDTQSYYIYFDEPKNHSDVMDNSGKFKTKNQIIENSSYPAPKQNVSQFDRKVLKKYSNQQRYPQYGEENDEARTPPVHVFSKKQPESKWVLEKKVKRLQKELNEIKKKEQRRQKLTNFSYNHPKKDEKVFVGRQVDQLINSLWP